MGNLCYCEDCRTGRVDLRTEIDQLTAELADAQRVADVWHRKYDERGDELDRAQTAIALEDAFLGWTGSIQSDSSTKHKRLLAAIAASRAAREARKACPHGYDRLANCPACKP